MKAKSRITVDGVEYVRADAAHAQNSDGLSYYIVRTQSAGVFAGYLARRDGMEVDLVNARRLWYWSGAATLSEMAVSGVKHPDKCKFAIPVAVTLTQVIELLAATEDAHRSIEGVNEWKA